MIFQSTKYRRKFERTHITTSYLDYSMPLKTIPSFLVLKIYIFRLSILINLTLLSNFYILHHREEDYASGSLYQAALNSEVWVHISCILTASFFCFLWVSCRACEANPYVGLLNHNFNWFRLTNSHFQWTGFASKYSKCLLVQRNPLLYKHTGIFLWWNLYTLTLEYSAYA